MIPKVIHYCWFGGNPLPDLAKKCIESWKLYCPDYEIKEWNESNYDISVCDYVREAYEKKQWAFVSDYVRLDIIYRYGGLYFDTDVELIKCIDDIIAKGPFMGMEEMEIGTGENILYVNPGLGLAGEAGMEIYEEILDFYQKQHFINADGTLNQVTIVRYTTDILNKYGFKSVDKVQDIKGILVYPPKYLCPMNYSTGEVVISEETRSIHHYSASWISEKERKHHKFGRWCRKRFGTKIGNKMERVYSLPFRVRRKVEEKGLVGTIKWMLNRR